MRLRFMFPLFLDISKSFLESFVTINDFFCYFVSSSLVSHQTSLPGLGEINGSIHNYAQNIHHKQISLSSTNSKN